MNQLTDSASNNSIGNLLLSTSGNGDNKNQLEMYKLLLSLLGQTQQQPVTASLPTLGNPMMAGQQQPQQQQLPLMQMLMLRKMMQGNSLLGGANNGT